MSIETQPILAFHGDVAIKQKYLDRLRQHQVANEIVQGKGGAVGCTLNKYSHRAFETELGIPIMLANLEDLIFEALSVEDSKDFPINFLSAIPIGKDLSNIYKHFFIWLLADPNDGVIKFSETNKAKDEILVVVAKAKGSLEREMTVEEWQEIRIADGTALWFVEAVAHQVAGYSMAAADRAGLAVVSAACASDDPQELYKKMAYKLIELLAA